MVKKKKIDLRPAQFRVNEDNEKKNEKMANK